MEGQAPSQVVPLTGRGSGLDQENIPVAGEGWSQGQHIGTEDKNLYRSRGLPPQNAPNMQTVQRCPWDSAVHKRRVQDAGR